MYYIFKIDIFVLQKAILVDTENAMSHQQGNERSMVYSLVARSFGLEYGGREFNSRSLHLKPETKLREEREVMLRAKIASYLVTSDCVSDQGEL